MRKPIAVIVPIKGIIISGGAIPAGPFPFMPFSGQVTESEDIVKYIEELNNNPRVRAFIFEIDSPGGIPYASKEIADAIKKIKKPTVANIREHGTSGAYWIASSCKKIIADPLSSIGGVGTRAERIDLSELAKKIGIRIDTFIKGEYKGIGSPYSQLSEKEKKFIEEHVEAYNNYFIEEIKQNRNIDNEKVLKDIKSGKPFLGKEALELGLIDYLGNGENAIKVACELAGRKLAVERRKEIRERHGLLLKILRRIF